MIDQRIYKFDAVESAFIYSQTMFGGRGILCYLT